ncbi:HNH endonuclease signature motif containing protein [Methylobacterium sp. D54C]
MSEDLREFLAATLARPEAPWMPKALRGMAKLSPPDRAFRWAGDVLRGDVHRQWADWFLGTFCDVDEYAASATEYPRIYAEVRAHVMVTWTQMDAPDQRALASAVARLAFAEARRRADVARRIPPSLSKRQQLIDLAGRTPHCWVCGWRFDAAAISSFLDEPAHLTLPPLVDVFKPIGLKARHLRIEADHLVPYADGGTDEVRNLRLGCGWCNTHRSNRTSIYQVRGHARPTPERSVPRKLPQPFWVVRLMAMEAARGGLSPAKGELSVALRNPRGGMNPANLMVVSYRDDPMGSARFQGRRTVAQLWGPIADEP